MVEPSVSVIIPVRSGGDSFRRCLLAVAEAAPPASEVIVLADGDEEGSRLLAEERGARVLRTSACSGPARARNLWGRAARVSDVLFSLMPT